MDNINQNNPNTANRENKDDNNFISNPIADSANLQESSLNKKMDSLMSSGKIGDEVSSYLSEMKNSASSLSSVGIPRPPETKTVSKQSIVRTLKTDTEEAIKLEQISSVSIALAEQKKKQKHPQTDEPSDPSKSKKIPFIVFSFIFVFAGIAAFNFGYIKDKVAPIPEAAPEIKSLILSDHNTELNSVKFENQKLASLLVSAIAGLEAKPNSIENIYITKNIANSDKEKEIKKPINSKEFLFLISSKTPDALLRSLLPEYMFGVHSLNGNHPFIILKTESYENAFAGMLSWEKNIGNDLQSIFSENNSMANLTANSVEPVFSSGKNFEDMLVKNKDARVLKDNNGNIILIYSIPDKETILITNNIETLTELFDRIIRSRAVR